MIKRFMKKSRVISMESNLVYVGMTKIANLVFSIGIKNKTKLVSYHYIDNTIPCVMTIKNENENLLFQNSHDINFFRFF